MGRRVAAVCVVALSCAAADASVIDLTSARRVVGAAIDLGGGRTASDEFSSQDLFPFDHKVAPSLTLPSNAGMGFAHAAMETTTTSSLISATGSATAGGFMNETVQEVAIGATATFIVEFTLFTDTQLHVLAAAWADPSDPAKGGTSLSLIDLATDQHLVDLRDVGSADLNQVFPAGDYLLAAVAFGRIKQDGPFPQHEGESEFSVTIRVVPAPATGGFLIAAGALSLRRRRPTARP